MNSEESAGFMRDLAEPEAGLKASLPSAEAESYRDALAVATGNPQAWCWRCHAHRVCDPPPDPEACRVPEPDARDSKKWGPSHQTADGVPIKDPHGSRGPTVGGGGR